MTSQPNGPRRDARRLSPADVRNLRFPRATMLHPGYPDEQVDRFVAVVADELDRLHAEKAELRDQVNALASRVEAVEHPEPPSDQAVRLLSTAQQTADAYVAEAEDFSRQMTADARVQHEETLRRAREAAGAILQSAHEAAQRMAAEGGTGAPAETPGRTTAELEEQVAYLKAFAQACRVQLRSYLEALLVDVESEWGRADPRALPQGASPGPRSVAPAVPEQPNIARETPMDDSATSTATASGVVESRS